jgi:hypothetical protein
VTAYASLVSDAFDDHVAPALAAMGFVRTGRRLAWTEGRLQIRAVVDSKASDPYRGGAFTLEFEVSDDGRFEEKLAGRVRIDQVLDDAQRVAFLGVRNIVARRLGTPPAEHLATLHPSIQEEYLKPFEESEELEEGHRFWMRFRTYEDLADWCGLIVTELPSLVERARSLPAHELILGKPLEW